MQFTWLPFTCLAWLCVTAPCALATANNPPLDQLPTWFADESYYRTRFPCSLQERQCFMQEQLLYPENGECYAVGEQGPCATGRIFHADFAEAQRLGGHLRGSCGALCEDDTQAPFIATGQCLTRSQVEAQFCRSDWYLQPVKDAFGQWVCQWTYLPCKPFLNHRRGIVPHDQLLSAPYHGLCWPPDIFWRVAAGNLTVQYYLDFFDILYQFGTKLIWPHSTFLTKEPVLSTASFSLRELCYLTLKDLDCQRAYCRIHGSPFIS